VLKAGICNFTDKNASGKQEIENGSFSSFLSFIAFTIASAQECFNALRQWLQVPSHSFKPLMCVLPRRINIIFENWLPLR
jgi:hypothetical protein